MRSSSGAFSKIKGQVRKKGVKNDTRWWIRHEWGLSAKLWFYDLLSVKLGGDIRLIIENTKNNKGRIIWREVARTEVYEPWLKMHRLITRRWEREHPGRKWHPEIIIDRVNNMHYDYRAREGLKRRGYSCEHFENSPAYRKHRS